MADYELVAGTVLPFAMSGSCQREFSIHGFEAPSPQAPDTGKDRGEHEEGLRLVLQKLTKMKETEGPHLKRLGVRKRQ